MGAIKKIFKKHGKIILAAIAVLVVVMCFLPAVTQTIEVFGESKTTTYSLFDVAFGKTLSEGAVGGVASGTSKITFSILNVLIIVLPVVAAVVAFDSFLYADNVKPVTLSEVKYHSNTPSRVFSQLDPGDVLSFALIPQYWVAVGAVPFVMAIADKFILFVHSSDFEKVLIPEIISLFVLWTALVSTIDISSLT